MGISIMPATAKIVPLAVKRRLACSACGAGVDAACGCGAAYVPAGERAAKAVKDNPGKSDRAIAAELGVSNKTVSRARATVSCDTVAKRTGRDGKARKLPIRPPAPVSDPVREVNQFHHELVGFLNDLSERFNAWHDSAPLLDDDGKAALRQAFYLCSDGLARLAQKL